VGIGTSNPDSSSKLEISSTNAGVLFPRMTTTQRNTIVNPAAGLLVYDLDKRIVYMFDGQQWAPLQAGSTSSLPGFPASASDGLPLDLFGYAVSIYGDYAIVGSVADSVGTNAGQGSAYIFFRNSNGVWIEQAKLTASDGAADDNFGFAVSIHGDYAVIGAVSDDVGINTDQGSAYVFYKGAGWATGQAHQAKLTASDGAAGDFFGGAVSISGDYLVISAALDNIGANGDQGSAYVYYRSTGWTTGQAHQAKLTHASGAADDRFGVDVSIDGDYLIAGALLDNISSNVNQGSAHIYGRIGTSWVFVAQLTASDGAADDNYGCSVSIHNDHAVIGSKYGDINTNDNQGSAYIYHKGSGWTTGQAHQAKLNAPDAEISDHFGTSTRINGDYIIVGSPEDDQASNTDQGSAYLFKRTGTIWTFVRKFDDATGHTQAYFGTVAGISGYNVIVGAFAKNVFQGEVSFLNFE
jgi:hypothetical protein